MINTLLNQQILHQWPTLLDFIDLCIFKIFLVNSSNNGVKTKNRIIIGKEDIADKADIVDCKW